MTSGARKLALCLLTLIFLCALVYSMIFISKTEAETASLIEQTNALLGNDGWARSVESIQNTLKDDLVVLEETVLTREELVSLIESLEDRGDALGLSVVISSLTGEKSEATSTSQTVKMTIATEGGWAESLIFLRILQSLPHKNQIEVVNLSKEEKGEWNSDTTLKFVIFPENL